MPTTKLIRIFVSSPGDVQNERKCIEKITKRLNKKFAPRLGYFFHPLLSETATRPGMGNSAQGVINKQIDVYEIYLGIMWKKFGTPTQKWESGTLEEVQNAMKLKREGYVKDIMFYFKDVNEDKLQTKEEIK